MHTFLKVGALVLVCTPPAAFCRGVDYLPFGSVRTGFILGPIPPSTADLDRHSGAQDASVPLLVRDFETLSEDPRASAKATRSSDRSAEIRPRIPARMHIGSSPATFTRPPFFPAVRPPAAGQGIWQEIPANCPHEEYRPKGLKRDVEERRARYYTLVVAIACRTGVPANLFDALITQESGYNPYARSIRGAIGMSQLMPATARSAGITNPWDIAENLRGGAQVLKSHLAEFGRYDLALAAYNAGAGRVRQTRRVPQIRETLTYVSSILSDVRRQYARAIGLSGYPGTYPAPLRTASLIRF